MPPESKPNTIIFRQGDVVCGEVERDVTYIASRPEVLPVLKDLAECNWGWLLTFHGTETELIAAGVASAAMFDIGKSVQRKYKFDYGDHCTVRRRGKKWDIDYHLHNEGSDALPSDEHPDKCPWWIKHGGAAEAATAEILKRFARPSPAVRP